VDSMSAKGLFAGAAMDKAKITAFERMNLDRENIKILVHFRWFSVRDVINYISFSFEERRMAFGKSFLWICCLPMLGRGRS